MFFAWEYTGMRKILAFDTVPADNGLIEILAFNSVDRSINEINELSRDTSVSEQTLMISVYSVDEAKG